MANGDYRDLVIQWAKSHERIGKKIEAAQKRIAEIEQKQCPHNIGNQGDSIAHIGKGRPQPCFGIVEKLCMCRCSRNEKFEFRIMSRMSGGHPAKWVYFDAEFKQVSDKQLVLQAFRLRK